MLAKSGARRQVMVCASSRAHIRLLNRNFRVCKGIQPSISIPQRNWRVCWKAVHSIKKEPRKFSHRVEELRLKAGNRSQLKLLDSLSAANTLAEPQNITENMLSAFFGYLIQRGNIPSHLRNLTRNAVRATQAATTE